MVKLAVGFNTLIDFVKPEVEHVVPPVEVILADNEIV